MKDIEWTKVVTGIAMVFAMIGNAGVLYTGSNLTTFDNRYEAQSKHRRSRFRNIEARLAALDDEAPARPAEPICFPMPAKYCWGSEGGVEQRCMLIYSELEFCTYHGEVRQADE